MNILKWFSANSWTEDTSNNEHVDYSYLLPVTVGLGSVVFGLLTYRNQLFHRKHDVVGSPISSLTGEPKILDPVRLTNPKKKLPKVVTKPNPSRDSIQPEKHIYETRTDSIGNHVQLKTSRNWHSTENSTTESGTSDSLVLSNPDPRNQNPSFEEAKTPMKKAKKPKKSPKAKDTEESPGEFVGENDSAWVVVTSKKTKSSTNNPEQTPQKSKKSKAKMNAESTLEVKITDEKQSISSPNQSILKDSSSGVSIDSKPFEEVKIISNLKISSSHTPNSSTQHPGSSQSGFDSSSFTKHTPNDPGSSAHTTNHLPADYDHSQAPNRPKETIISPVHVNQTSKQPDQELSSPREQISAFVEESSKQKSSTELSTTQVMTSQHLSAQMKAKEVECQLLREEIKHLRNELKSVKLNFQRDPHCIPSSDACTMTLPKLAPIMEDKANSVCDLRDHTESLAVHHEKPATADADILISTLQSEIARLAREAVISQQRNQNLEARLEAANKKLAGAKAKASHAAKSVRNLISLNEQVEVLAKNNAQMETELNEALQRAEMQRRKMEESEHNLIQRSDELERLRMEHNTLLMKFQELENTNISNLSKIDRTLQDYNNLSAKHETLFSDYSLIQSRNQELQSRLEEKESMILAQASESHAALAESKKRVTELDSLVTSYRDKESQDALKLSVAMDQISSLQNEMASLRAELDALKMKRLNQPENSSYPNDSSEAIPNQSEQPQSALVHSTISSDKADTVPELMLQIEQYRYDLDKAENILAKLQNSVDEEEGRWRKALDASTIECEMLQEKVTKLEAAMNGLVEERNTLTQTIEDLRKGICPTIADGELDSVSEKSSVYSVSLRQLTDNLVANENTPHHELLHIVKRLRCLVEVEHDALKKEQAQTTELRSQLDTLKVQAAGNHLSYETKSNNGGFHVINGGHIDETRKKSLDVFNLADNEKSATIDSNLDSPDPSLGDTSQSNRSAISNESELVKLDAYSTQTTDL